VINAGLFGEAIQRAIGLQDIRDVGIGISGHHQAGQRQYHYGQGGRWSTVNHDCGFSFQVPAPFKQHTLIDQVASNPRGRLNGLVLHDRFDMPDFTHERHRDGIVMPEQGQVHNRVPYREVLNV
jgi:hypothetical protein